MSGTEFEPPRQLSTVKIGQTAAGKPQIEVKVVEGAVQSELERVRALAVHAYKETLRDLAV